MSRIRFKRPASVNRSETEVPRLRAHFPARCTRGRSRSARDDNSFYGLAARLKPCPYERRQKIHICQNRADVGHRFMWYAARTNRRRSRTATDFEGVTAGQLDTQAGLAA